MKRKWILLFILVTCIGCNKNTKEIFDEGLQTDASMETPAGVAKDAKQAYIKQEIPLPPLNQEKEEYFRLLTFGSELRALVFYDVYEELEDSVKMETHLKLYRLEDEEWFDSGIEWTVDHIGVMDYYYDTSGILYAFVNESFVEELGVPIEDRLKKAKNRNASKVLVLYDNGDTEFITLDNKDILQEASIHEIPANPDSNNRKTSISTPNIEKFYLLENNKAALLYFIPNTGYQFITYDLVTGKAQGQMDFPGSSAPHSLITNDKLVCYWQPETDGNVASSLLVTDIKTGKYVGKCYFGNEWDKMDGMDFMLRFVIASGMEDDVYVYAYNGIYGGSIDKGELSLIIPPSELDNDDPQITSLLVGDNKDFYMVSGSMNEAYDRKLYHYVLEE